MPSFALLRISQRLLVKMVTSSHPTRRRRLTPTSTPTPSTLSSPPRCYSSSSNVAATISHLRINASTRVIFQGFTGRQATANAQESIAWGTNIVGGVTPNREGHHLDLPLLPSVRRAVAALQPDATGIYVPAPLAPAAIQEAIEAEVPLIVAVAEHIPVHAMLRIHAMLRTQTRSRLVGPNSPGIVSSTAGQRCRIGFHPLPVFSAGVVGIAAKSGTLSYETAASTTRAGLGQSLCIGVGGDMLPGTDLVEALEALMGDEHTKAVALVGEVGGDGEMKVAEWLRRYHEQGMPSGGKDKGIEKKPIVALVAGAEAPPGLTMGHSGAFWVPGEPTVAEKVRALEGVGVRIVNHPAKIGPALKEMLGEVETAASASATRQVNTGHQVVQQQRRGMATLATRTRPIITNPSPPSLGLPHQTRSLHLDLSKSIQVLSSNPRISCQTQLAGLPLKWDRTHTQPATAFGQVSASANPLCYLAIRLDRSEREPCILAARLNDKPRMKPRSRTVPEEPVAFRSFPLGVVFSEHPDFIVGRVMKHLWLDSRAKDQLEKALSDLVTIFYDYQAKFVNMEIALDSKTNELTSIQDLQIEVDGSAVALAATAKTNTSSNLNSALFQVQQVLAAAQESQTLTPDDKASQQAKAHGIVYHKLGSPSSSSSSSPNNIGTLVNGAGLAMNTVDALRDAGGHAANFLDTGGKATSETIKESFRLILRDSRVKVVFVNIFGGLTLGDMIARGIILAFKEVAIKVPVVVRIRGTNEKEGQEIISQSGLPLFAFDDFEEAAAKAVELARDGEEKEKEKEAAAKGAVSGRTGEEGNGTGDFTGEEVAQGESGGNAEGERAFVVHQETDDLGPDEGARVETPVRRPKS